MKTLSRFAILVSCLFPVLASAHHGPPTDPALFNTERIIEMDAEIVAVFWRNPHVRYKIKITDDYGDEVEWQMELRRGPTSFNNLGITKDFLQPGDKIRVAGYPSRRKPNLLGVMNVLLPDGRELAEPNVEARFSDSRLLSGIPGENLQAPERKQVAVEQAPESIFRVWGMVGSRIPEVPISEYVDYLSDTAHQLRARFVPARDDPELKCQSGMPSTMFDPPPMEVRRDGDNVVIHLEEYDIVRTIHIGEMAEGPTPSRLGFSVGRWENERTLVVSTTHVDWPFFDPWGTPQSAGISYVEQFTLSADEHRLDYSLTADDPVMFVEPVVLERAWRWLPDRQLNEYDCTLWDGDTEYDPVVSNPFND